MPPNAPEDMTGTCYLCTDVPTGPDDFCYGCQQPICQDCSDKNIDIPFGVHDPEVHVEPDDEFDDYEEEDDD